LDAGGVWILSKRKSPDYSDEVLTQRNLDKILSSDVDLGYDSYKFQQRITDRPSEYHLNTRRIQLLKGFQYNRNGNILEIGCGCGAITRFLGERFDSVISIEGSMNRAQLARKRTKDMDNVSILCAPFQDISFKIKFDIVFCIGGLEYAGTHIHSDDPYQDILNECSNILTPDGVLVLALENQFGLKYFFSSREDHTGLKFEGLEGYPRSGNRVKTFGYKEIKDRLLVNFNDIQFYFPYPDYKIPSAVISEQLFEKAGVAELIGGFSPRDYWGDMKSPVDLKLMLMELEKNKKLAFFADSFLIHAAKQTNKSIRTDWLGIMYSDKRIPKLQMVTKIVEDEKGSLFVDKYSPNTKGNVQKDKLILHPGKYPWLEGVSLHMQVLRQCKDQNASLEDIFSLCAVWVNAMRKHCVSIKGKLWLDGKYIDDIWQNCIIQGSQCCFFDNEWEWKDKIPLNVFLIRSLVYFLGDVLRLNNPGPALCKKNMLILCNDIAGIWGIALQYKDFIKFIKFESEFQRTVIGTKKINTALSLCRFFLKMKFKDKQFSEGMYLKKILLRLKNIFRI